jgi:integrase
MQQGGLHAFRRGCNRHRELAGVNPAVIRQQMGHGSTRMTALYSREILLEQVWEALAEGTEIVVFGKYGKRGGCVKC